MASKKVKTIQRYFWHPTDIFNHDQLELFLGNPFLSTILNSQMMCFMETIKIIFRELLLTVPTTCEYETCVIHTTCGWYPPIYQHIQRLAKYQRTTTRILIGVEKPNLQNWILCHFMWIVCYLRRDL